MVMDRRDGSRMRVELDDSDKVSRIRDIVTSCWSCRDFMFRNGYFLLSDDSQIRDCICDGDTIDILMDPDAGRCAIRY